MLALREEFAPVGGLPELVATASPPWDLAPGSLDLLALREEFPPLGGLPEAVATALPLETSPLGVSICSPCAGNSHLQGVCQSWGPRLAIT